MARSAAIDEQMAQGSAGRELPPFFYFVLWFFTLAGVILFFAGIWGVLNGRVAGGWHASLIGAIYSLFGLTVAGVTWTLKQHFEGIGFTNPAGLSEQQQEADTQLLRTRHDIAALIGRAANGSETPHDPSGTTGHIDQTEIILQSAARLSQLEALQQEEQQIQGQRRRLSEFRETLRRHQQQVGLRRRQWCDTLRELGIAETLKIDTALAQIPQSLTVGDTTPLREWARLQGELEAEHRIVEEYQRRIEGLSRQLPLPPGRSSTVPEQRVTSWVEMLAASDRAQEERVRLRKDSRTLRSQATELDAPIARLESEKQDLFVQAGVTSRQELEVKTRAWRDMPN